MIICDFVFFGDIYKQTKMDKICDCCQKKFKTYKKEQKYCSKICGQCNKKQNKLIKECEFTGCTNSFEALPKSTQKFCSKKCQCLWQKIHQLGENNGNFGRENKWGTHNNEMRLLISDKISDTWKNKDRVIKHNLAREMFKSIHGYLPNNSPSAREKISESNVRRYLETGHLTTYKNCKRGYYKNLKNKCDEYYHSSWEEILMVELDNDINVIFWTKKHNIIVKYKHDGIIKSYIPDFYVEYSNGDKVIEEVKGFIDDVEVFKLKKMACEKYCSLNGLKYKINFMKNYEKYKHLL